MFALPKMTFKFTNVCMQVAIVAHVLVRLPLKASAIKYLYIARFESGSGCATFDSNDWLGLEGECTLDGPPSYRIDCSSDPPNVLIPYDTADCSGDVSTTNTAPLEGLCINGEGKLYCASEPTIFKYEYFHNSDCSAQATQASFYSPALCLG